MYASPSYLSGLAEIEPHNRGPAVPRYLQSIVSNTPLNVGDGVPVVPVTRKRRRTVVNLSQRSNKMRSQRNFGAAECLPCRAIVRNPISFGSVYGEAANANANAPWKFGDNIKDMLSDLTPEQKKGLQSGVMSAASMAACEKFGILCPKMDTTGTVSAPIGMYVVAGIFGLAFLGLGIAIVVKL